MFNSYKEFFLSLLMFFLIVGCSDSKNKTPGDVSMKITSSAFEEGGLIPRKFTCDDIDVSPPLAWHHAPEGTKEFALICDDPDAPMGTWVHWVIYNIPVSTNKFEEGIQKESALDNGIIQGRNDFRKTGYGGPCPPGGTHRYFFKLYALDINLNLGPGKTKSELLKAIEGHILAESQLMGKYSR